MISAGSPLAGQRVTVRLDGPVAHILAEGNAVRTVACPVPPSARQRQRLRGARAGTAGPPQLPGPLTVRRRVSIRGAIMIGGQRIQVGLPHAGKTAEVTVEADTYQITVEDDIAITAPRKTSRDIKRHKASSYPPRLRLLLMNGDRARQWTDRSCLQQVQYRTDANLAARQSLYAHQHPRINLPATVLDLAALRGDESFADVGCGNGAYLAELSRRHHAGPVVGIDLSTGMLGAARRRAPAAALAAGDAAALPVRDHAASLTLAAHMLYHVPDLRVAVRELRRVTRADGQVLVVLNGDDHLRELRDLIASLQIITHEGPLGDQLRLDDGQELMSSEFTSVIRHDFTGELRIPGPEPIENYVRSMISIQDQPDPAAVAAAVASHLPTGGGPFRIRTHTGCLICT